VAAVPTVPPHKLKKKSKRTTCVGYVARMAEARNAYTFFLRNLKGRNNSKEIVRRR
jgi:hypothetical protein